MKKIIRIFVFASIFFPNAFAQTIKSGINTEVPNSTLTVGGSFGAAYREITTSTTLTDQDIMLHIMGHWLML